jgi:hypothetical protein
MTDDAADAAMAASAAQLNAFLLERVPEFATMLDELGSWNASHFSYAIARTFYTFTVQAWEAGRHDVVSRALQCADQALGEAEPIELPIAIDYFEPLADDWGVPHYQPFVDRLGARGRARLEEILTGDSSES